MGTTVAWVDFLRCPDSVLEAVAADGRVTLVRTAGPSMRLADAAEASALEAVADLLALAVDDVVLERMAGQLTTVLPWTAALPEAQRLEFLDDCLAEIRAPGRPSRLAATVAAWRDTAAAYVDPHVRVDGSDLHYLEEPVALGNPRLSAGATATDS